MFTHLVLGGGAFCGMVYLGALRYLQERRYPFSHISGSSIGAFFAFLFTLGIPMWEVEEYMIDYLQELSEKSSLIGKDDIIGFCENFSILSADILRTPLVHFLERQYQIKDITFLELAKKTGKNLIVAATDLGTTTPFYFSIDTAPVESVIDALCASMAIPFLFPPMRLRDTLYIDASVTDNIPIPTMPQSHDPLVLILETSWKQKDADSFWGYSGMVLDCITKNLAPLKVRPKHIVSFSNIPISPLPFLFTPFGIELKITSRDITELSSYGYHIIESELLLKEGQHAIEGSRPIVLDGLPLGPL